MIEAADGTGIDEGKWAEMQHAVVFKALKRGLGDVEFPASKEKILRTLGEERVTVSPEIRLGPYLETLPEERYESGDDVARALNQTWVRAFRQV